MSCTREQALSNCGLQVKKVDVEDWGGDGTCWVKRLGGPDLFAAQGLLEDIAKASKKSDDPSLALGRLAVLLCCDRQGKALYREADAKVLATGPLMPLSNVMTAGIALNRWGPRAAKKLVKKSKRVRRSKRG